MKLTIPRSSNSNSASNKDESSNQEKTPFGYSRKDVLLIGLGLTVAGVGLKSGLEVMSIVFLIFSATSFYHKYISILSGLFLILYSLNSCSCHKVNLVSISGVALELYLYILLMKPDHLVADLLGDVWKTVISLLP